VTDGDFEKAAAKPVSGGAKNGADSGASHSGLDRTSPQTTLDQTRQTADYMEVSACAARCEAEKAQLLGDTGLEPVAIKGGKNKDLQNPAEKGGAESGASCGNSAPSGASGAVLPACPLGRADADGWCVVRVAARLVAAGFGHLGGRE